MNNTDLTWHVRQCRLHTIQQAARIQQWELMICPWLLGNKIKHSATQKVSNDERFFYSCHFIVVDVILAENWSPTSSVHPNLSMTEPLFGWALTTGVAI